MRDALIQRFEFTYELAWKTIQLYLEAQQITAHSPKEALQAALKNDLISDGNGWSNLYRYRNLIPQAYDEELAVEVATCISTQGSHLFGALEQPFKAGTHHN